MLNIYFNLSEGKLHANTILDAFESIYLNRTKSILKCKMLALKHSMVSLNDETRELKSVLTSLENKIYTSQSKIKTVREIIIKRNKTLKICEKQIREINTEAANIRNGKKRIVGSKMAEKKYPASKKYFNSSQLVDKNNVIKNFDIMKYLESNFERCSENTRQIEVEEKRQLEHQKYLENSLILKRKEKFKNNNNQGLHQKEDLWKFGTREIRQGRVCKKRKMENIKAINENKTNQLKSRSRLYSSAFTKLNKYTEETKSTSVRRMERQVSVPLDNASTNIKNRLGGLQLNLDQTKFTLPTGTKMERQQYSTYSSAHNNELPIIKVNLFYKKLPQKKYSQITRSASEIIYSQGSQLLEDTFTFSAKSEPKMTLQTDTSNIKDRDDEVKIIYDSYYSPNCLKFNKVTQELEKKDLVTLKEIEESISDIKMEQTLSDLEKTDLEEVYSNNIIKTKRKLYKRLQMQMKATAQLKVFLHFKFKPGISLSLITKTMKVVNISRLANNTNKTKKGLTEKDSDKVNDETIEQYLVLCNKKTISSKTFTKTPTTLRLSISLQEIVFQKIQHQQLSMRNLPQLQYKILLSRQNMSEEYADLGNQEQVYCRKNASIHEPDFSDNQRVQLKIKTGDSSDTSSVRLHQIKEALKETSSDQTGSKPLINIGIHAETQTSSRKEKYKAIPETRDQTTGTNLVESLRNETVYISGKKPEERTQYTCENTVKKKKQLTKEGTRTLRQSIFIKKRLKDVKLCEKRVAVEAVLPKREKKVVGQRCISLNNNRTIQGKVKMMKSMGKEDKLNENKKKNINNSLAVKSIPELDTIESDLREVVQQITKLELEKFFKNRTESKIYTDTSIRMEETALDTDSKLECETNTQQNTINEDITEERTQCIELLSVSENIKDETVFHMIHSLKNLQACLSKCQTNENMKFPKENLEKLFTVFIELMTELYEFCKSNNGINKKIVSTTEDVNTNEDKTQELVPADNTEMESYKDTYNEKLEVKRIKEINTDVQQILIQKIESTEETKFLDENESKKGDINEEQLPTSQIYEGGCRLDGNMEETEDADFFTPHKRVRFDQNCSPELKSSRRCLKADRLQRNPERVDRGVLVKPNKNRCFSKRDFGASNSMTKSKVDFGTSFDLNKKICRPKTCTCNYIKSQNRGHFGIITELMRSMDKTHHVNKFNLKARDFQNNYDHYRICRTVTNLMRGLGDEHNVIGPTIKNCTGTCQKVTNDGEFQSVGEGKNYHDFSVVGLRNDLGHELIPNLKQFDSRRRSVFEDLLPFGKRFVLTPRRSYY